MHVFPVRVYYEDTDAAGMVYHSNYLQFAERARTELLRHFGLQQSRLWTEQGIGFVMRRCVVDFLAPARLDDLLLVTSRLIEMRGASLDFQQNVTRDGLELVRLAGQAGVHEQQRPAGAAAAHHSRRAGEVFWQQLVGRWKITWLRRRRSPAPPGMACHPGRCS